MKQFKDRKVREEEVRQHGKEHPLFATAFMVLVPVLGAKPIFQTSGIEILQGTERQATSYDVYTACQYIVKLYEANMAADEVSERIEQHDQEAADTVKKMLDDPLLQPVYRSDMQRRKLNFPDNGSGKE